MIPSRASCEGASAAAAADGSPRCEGRVSGSVRAAAAEEARAGRDPEEAAQLVKVAKGMRDRMSDDACTLPDMLNGRLDFQVLLAVPYQP